MGVVRLHNNILIKIFILFFNYPAFEFNFLNNIKLLNYLLFYSLVLGLTKTKYFADNLFLCYQYIILLLKSAVFS